MRRGRPTADPGRADPAGHLGAAPPGLRPATVPRDGRLLQLRDLLLHHLHPHRRRAAVYGYGLKFAGPIVNSVGWPVVSLFTLCVAASMAELASAYPTAGEVTTGIAGAP